MGVRTCAQAGILSKLFFWWLNDLLCLGYNHKLKSHDLNDQLLKEDSSEKLSSEAFNLWDLQIKNYEAQLNSLTKVDEKEQFCKIKKPSLFFVIRKQFGCKYILLGILPFIEECGLRIFQPILIGAFMQKLALTEETSGGNVGPPYLEASLIILCSILSVFTTHWFYFSVQHIGMKVRIVCSSLIYRKCLYHSDSKQGKLLNLLSSDVQRFDQSCVSLHYLWIAPCNLVIVFTILYQEFGFTAIIGLIFLMAFTLLQALLGIQFSKLRTKTASETDARLEFMSGMLKKMKQIKMLGLEEMYKNTCRKLRKNEINIIKQTAALRALNLTLFYSGIKIVFFALIWWYGSLENSVKVFVTLALFNNIRNLITSYFPNGILQLAEARVAMERIENYLNLPSVENFDTETNFNYFSKNKPTTLTAEHFVNLCNVTLRCREEKLNLDVKLGELIHIVGSVGTGKTTLLKAILQETNILKGIITHNGQIAYCAQTPWIYPASMQDNIILNLPFDQVKYDRIIHACSLNKDLGQINMERLSGGMRARISLARAAYSNADIYLLDDPFAALDKNTKTHIIKELLHKFLQKKICIICGESSANLNATKTISLDGTKIERRESLAAVPTSNEETDQKAAAAKVEDDRIEIPDESVLKSGTGVCWKTFYKYFKSGCGSFGLVLLIIVNLLTQASFTGTDYYLRIWTSKEAPADSMTVYGILTGIIFIMSLLRTFMFFRVCLKSSVNIHEKIFGKVITSKLEFFHSHGKILNRFGKDFALMDESLPTTFFSACGVLLQVLGTIILISVLQPYSLIPAFILSILFYTLRRFYIRTGCTIRRLEALGISPLYTLVSATGTGLSTIRTYNAQDKFLNEFQSRLDRHSASWYINLATSRWFGIWLDWISVLYTAVVVSSFVVGHHLGTDAGLAITSVLFLAGTFQLGARQSADAENQLVAVERILEYEKLDVEDFESGREDVDIDGPIEFKNVKVVYEDNNKVLNDITFTINKGEKVALLGRTGCGKSTLLKALYRLCDYTGSISFNYNDAQHIKLHSLRSSVSIIPQEPYIFKGTVRDNLDPHNILTDDQICIVFNRFNSYFDGSIYSEVEEDGHNLSQGQKQILSLVRVILKRNKILVLDEPTANLDSKVDELIKQSLTEFCSNCTVITVAHRLQTVAHYDRAFVIKSGELKETVLTRNTQPQESTLQLQPEIPPTAAVLPHLILKP